jgi:hypothetical protein
MVLMVGVSPKDKDKDKDKMVKQIRKEIDETNDQVIDLVGPELAIDAIIQTSADILKERTKR